MRVIAAILSLLLASFVSVGNAKAESISNRLPEKPISFESKEGEKVEAFEGSFVVPENRADPSSRMLTLRYVRFPAIGEVKASPIVYLAGGPGGSGISTAKNRRFHLFMAMREFGDVIALDQRGTGASNDLPNCVSEQKLGSMEVISDISYMERHQEALRECLAFWKAKAIDLRGYNTRENASDLDDLRRHLSAEKLSIWGISYGSHLALAAVKQMESNIDRIVIASAEGLDQTIKLPARTDVYFSRLQAAVNTQPEAKASFPDIVALIRRVHTKLEKKPILIKARQKDGSVRDYLWQRRNMQQAASGTISDPVPASLLLKLYAELDAGETKLLERVAPFLIGSSEKISYWPMSALMDVASGTGADRRQQIVSQAKTSLLATYLNQPVELEDVDPSLVLDETFREAPVSDVPILLLSGTLDGRTYIESQQEAVKGFSNIRRVTVRNAGHNLFKASPEVIATMGRFMRGELTEDQVIEAPLPDMMTAGLTLIE